MMAMDGKVVLITGAAKRVGAVVAKTLHDQGATIIIHYHHSRQAAEDLVAGFNRVRKHSAVALQANLQDMQDVHTLAKAAALEFNRIDVLINNASSFYPTPVGDATLDDWNNLFSTNAQAPFFLSQALADTLKQHCGVIINMVDIHGDRPLKDHPIYCMAKAALIAMTKALAKDLAPEVRVNGIAPGMIMWPDGDELDEKTKKMIINRVALKKPGEPQFIADSILFLIQQSYVTGHILTVDGGRTLTV